MLDNLITVYNEYGQEINVSSLGLTGMKLGIPSPSYQTVVEEIDGRSSMVVDRILSSRSLTADFISKAKNYDDSLTVRDKLFEMLGNGRVFYVSESKNPLRRWKVYLDSWTPDRLDVSHHRFEIPLFAESGCSESISIIKKTFNSPIFKFKNGGSIIIDPNKQMETEIEFKGASSKLIIRNKTTGEEWSWTGDTLEGDSILLKGVSSFKNNSSIYGQSNKKVITMTPGWNDFEIIGATGDFQLNIRSRFYFL